MKQKVSIAIETSCRVGGIALGLSRELVKIDHFEAAARHATQLVVKLKDILESMNLACGDIEELYVSVGPGSFTGLRVGITAARALAQAVKTVRCVAVPTAMAVAHNARDLEWENLGVVMDARRGSIYATLFVRRENEIVEAAPGQTMVAEEFLAVAPRPLLLIGEGLAFQDMKAPDVRVIDPDNIRMHLPTADNVWHVGQKLAQADKFVDYNHLLPIYARKPEALRLWEKREGGIGG